MFHFSADDAFDVQGTDDAVVLTTRQAARLLGAHSVELCEYRAETGDLSDTFDAGVLLAFLGY